MKNKILIEKKNNKNSTQCKNPNEIFFPKDYIEVGFLIKIFKYKCSQGNNKVNRQLESTLSPHVYNCIRLNLPSSCRTGNILKYTFSNARFFCWLWVNGLSVSPQQKNTPPRYNWVVRNDMDVNKIWIKIALKLNRHVYYHKVQLVYYNPLVLIQEYNEFFITKRKF